MKILGISCFYHDSAACVVCDGEVIAAVQEERFTRKKHDAGFPINAINYCLQEAEAKGNKTKGEKQKAKGASSVCSLFRPLFRPLFPFRPFRLFRPLFDGEKHKRQQHLLVMAVGFSIILLASTTSLGGEKSRLVSNLDAGKKQTVVTYGTSLTAGGAWVVQFSAELNRQYPGLATVINSGKGGHGSRWGVNNLQDRVIDKQADVVFIEFSINDAYRSFYVSVARARANLETMIDRIFATNKSCEIILMVMNPPVGSSLKDRPKIESYNQMYRDVAAERHLMIIDHYPNWQKILKDDPRLFSQYVPDGLHPNAEGCEAVITPKIICALGMKTEPQDRVDAEKPHISR